MTPGEADASLEQKRQVILNLVVLSTPPLTQDKLHQVVIVVVDILFSPPTISSLGQVHPRISSSESYRHIIIQNKRKESTRRRK